MQVSTQVMTREKNVAVNKNFILRKMGLKFQNPKPCLVRQLRKIVIFIRKKISDYMKPNQPAFTIPASQVSELAHFDMITFQAYWENTFRFN